MHHYTSTLGYYASEEAARKDSYAIIELRRELGIIATGDVRDSNAILGWTYTFSAPRELSREEQEVLFLSPINYGGDIG